MDFSKFKTSDWLVIGGGIAFLIFGTFVHWASVSFKGFGSASGGNAFDFFFTGTIPWILLIGAAVLTVLRVQGIKLGSAPWPLIILAATVVGGLLVVIRMLVGPGDGLDRAAGLWLSALAGIVSAVGGVLGFMASGGDLNDLKDINKIKGAFSQGGSGGSASGPGNAPPPPPPGGPSAPPPPPPPPA